MANHRGGSWLKWLIILLLVGGAAAGGFWYYQKTNSEAPEYQMGTVSRGDLTQTVTATGQLNPVVNVQVGSQVSGRINKINVDYNSQVKSNQVIAEIDPATYQAGLLRAEAEAANAKANADLARIQAQRADSMFTNKLISASDHDIAAAQAEQASAQLKIAQAAVETARVDLSRCTILAPVDGVVISRNVDVGQTFVDLLPGRRYLPCGHLPPRRCVRSSAVWATSAPSCLMRSSGSRDDGPASEIAPSTSACSL